MKILSLFDGIACGMLAMLECGITAERYVAYEIDKYAVKTSSHNFPMIEHRGDVFGADFSEFRGFDFLVGGSPCTYWSIAQTRNRETVASGMGWELFCQYKRALDEAQPRYFIYENNKSMSAAIRQSITEAFGFEPVCINSALVSAQNRQRLYWVGRREVDGTYSRVHVDQPEDRGILLRDVLDGAVAESVLGADKARTLGAHYARAEAGAWYKRVYNDNPNKQQYDYVAEPVRIGTYPNNAKNQAHDSQQYRIYDTDAKSVTLCGNGGGMGAKTGLYAIPCEPNRVASINNGGQGDRIYSIDAKSCALKAQSGGAGGYGQGLYAIPVEFDGDIPTFARSGADGKVYLVYRVKGGIITIKDKQYPIKLADGYYIIRKLTVSECKRLQTVPEWYEFPVSDTQAYKMLGNGWTVLVIAHLIRAIADIERSLHENE